MMMTLQIRSSPIQGISLRQGSRVKFENNRELNVPAARPGWRLLRCRTTGISNLKMGSLGFTYGSAPMYHMFYMMSYMLRLLPLAMSGIYKKHIMTNILITY